MRSLDRRIVDVRVVVVRSEQPEREAGFERARGFDERPVERLQQHAVDGAQAAKLRDERLCRPALVFDHRDRARQHHRERFLQRRDARAGMRRPLPGAGVEFARTREREVHDAHSWPQDLRCVGGPVEREVVQAHERAAGRDLHVELLHRRAEFGCARERRQRVLGEVAAVSAVRGGDRSLAREFAEPCDDWVLSGGRHDRGSIGGGRVPTCDEGSLRRPRSACAPGGQRAAKSEAVPGR